MDEHDQQAQQSVEDLDVPKDAEDEVKGGSLNTYVSKVQGEKQGGFVSKVDGVALKQR